MNQKKSNNIYKMYQLMEFFATKYSFSNTVIRNNNVHNEIWLTNRFNHKYNVIRISLSSLDKTYHEAARIQKCLQLIEDSIKLQTKFLDIHVSGEQACDIEMFDTVCIDTNYYSGLDVAETFPGIGKVVHEVKDPEKEIEKCLSNISKNLRTFYRQRHEILFQKAHLNATLIIQIICVINFIIYFILSRKFDSSTAQILVGADFKFFTVFLNEIWRLFTYAFCHGSLLHLFVNMYTLYIIGNYIEMHYGTIKYLIILFSAIIIAGLTQDVLTGFNNTLTVGMSGGIYALFVIYIIEALENGAYHSRGFMAMIFINVLLNFMSNVAWQAHLGGIITGIIFYYGFKNHQVDYRICLLALVVIIGVGYKLYTINDLNEYYFGTVYSVIDAYRNLGFNGIADKLTSKALQYFMK